MSYSHGQSVGAVQNWVIAGGKVKGTEMPLLYAWLHKDGLV